MKNLIYLFTLCLIVFTSCKSTTEEEIPIACFTFNEGGIINDSASQTTITPTIFSNCSENSTSYLWNFGDGSTSTVENPDHSYLEDGEYIVSLIATNTYGSSSKIDTVYINWLSVDKPNIYIYPDITTEITVGLNFPQGGRIIKSIPEAINNSWQVNIDPNGKINDTYDFLFYESIQPDVWQYKEGWCVSVDSLEDFFNSNLSNYNFSNKEIFDFIEFWIPILKEYNYYKIYPQTNETIETVVQLNLSSNPDNLRRLFYRVVGSDEFTNIPPAHIEEINREGYHIFEWGVIWK